MARPLGGGEASTDLRQRLSFLKKRPRDPGQVVFAGLEQHHHEPLEVNVVDTSTGTGGLGSCGEGADKSSPSSGQGCAATTATASPRSLAATTASMTTPSHSPGFIDPDAIMTSNDDSSPTPSPENVNPSDGVETEEPKIQINGSGEDVVLRRNTINGYRRAILKRNSYSTNEAGRLLKFCLEKHFAQPNESKSSGSCQNEALDNYISEVFHQLDYHRCGTVSREDFDTLCEVLDLRPVSRPTSGAIPTTSHYRLSGLEWLSSYRPDRGRSPLSPLRPDKLSEVKYRGPKRVPNENGTVHQPPNFLFTIGPRPFWEMWPQKKRRKRRLNIDEFKRALLEQWAKTHGIASNRVSVLFSPLINLASASTPTPVYTQQTMTSNGTIHHRNHRHIRSVRVQPIPVVDTVDHARNGHVTTQRSQGLPASNKGRNNHHQPQRSVHYETRTKRFFRRLARVSRRVHFIRRLSRRIRRENIGPPLQPRIPINPALRPEAIHPDVTDHHIPADSTTEPTLLSPPPNMEKQKHRVHLLERQVEHQQTEISGLRDVVEDLRSSLHLSDAQNLALQVLLKKMSKAEVEVMGHDSFRSQMNESEKHLENLVKELKEMSQTRYPRYLPHANMNGASSSTATSINNEGNMTLPDFVLEDEVHETSKVLGEASDELKAATNELQTTVTRLTSSSDNEEELSLQEAYRALERAQEEINKMR